MHTFGYNYFFYKLDFLCVIWKGSLANQ